MVTDLEDIVNRLGYKEDDVRRALAQTNGDRDAALRLLTRCGGNIDLKNAEVSNWRQEEVGDWFMNVSQSLSKENRALLKVHIPSIPFYTLYTLIYPLFPLIYLHSLHHPLYTPIP
jgi:hypothetical protein